MVHQLLLFYDTVKHFYELKKVLMALRVSTFFMSKFQTNENGHDVTIRPQLLS